MWCEDGEIIVLGECKDDTDSKNYSADFLSYLIVSTSRAQFSARAGGTAVLSLPMRTPPPLSCTDTTLLDPQKDPCSLVIFSNNHVYYTPRINPLLMNVVCGSSKSSHEDVEMGAQRKCLLFLHICKPAPEDANSR